MNDFFVGRTEGGENSAEFCLVAYDKIIGRQSGPSRHRHHRIGSFIEIGGLEQPSFVKLLQYIGSGRKRLERMLQRRSPLDLRQIMSDGHTSAAPSQL